MTTNMDNTSLAGCPFFERRNIPKELITGHHPGHGLSHTRALLHTLVLLHH